MYPEQNDTNFLQGLQARNSGAFDRLYMEYYRPLCYFAEGLVNDSATAEDIATESFIKLLQRSGSFDGEAGIKAFLYTVTRNACVDYLRANERHTHSHEEIRYLTGFSDEDAERQMIRSEVLQAIYASIEQLPEKYKGIVKLALLEGKKNEEIAAALDISDQTVRNRKSEGFKLLRIQLIDQQNLSPLVLSYCLMHLL